MKTTITCRVCRTVINRDDAELFLEGTTKRYRCKTHNTRTPALDTTPVVDNTPEETIPIDELNLHAKEHSSYVVTSAQNNTPVHKEFLDNLLNYCSLHDAELIIIPFRYRNPTTPESDETSNIWYDSRIEPYLVNQRFNLLDKVRVIADISIRPTTRNPLSGKEILAAGKSAIFPHTQLAMQMIATQPEELPLIMHTTGAITQKNYSGGDAGIRAKADHSFSAILVKDMPNNGFAMRALTACDDGSFIDLGEEYKDGSDPVFVGADALMMGDIHVGSDCPVVKKASIKMMKELQVKQVFLPDVFDGETVNHHEDKNPFAKFSHKFRDLDHELEAVKDYINELDQYVDEVVIVDSNHNDFLQRWVARADWKFMSPTTARLYLKFAQTIIETGTESIFTDEMLERGAKARFLNLKESYRVHDIEMALHGHLGANGARGSHNTFRKAGFKSIIQHRHSPGIHGGCYYVGTSTKLILGYTKGLSSWLNTHCLVYPNGKRQLINIIDGLYN